MLLPTLFPAVMVEAMEGAMEEAVAVEAVAVVEDSENIYKTIQDLNTASKKSKY